MLFLIGIPILILYVFFITNIINKYIEQKDTNWKQIIKNIVLLLSVSIVAFFTMYYFLFDKYVKLIPSSSSDLCSNSGGWVYSCKGDLKTAPILLLLMLLIIVIHHFVSFNFICKVFEYSKKIFKYIFMYIYMALLLLFNYFLLLNIYGVLIGVYYDSVIVEILRLIVFISPTGLFIVSTLIYALKNKNKK